MVLRPWHEHVVRFRHDDGGGGGGGGGRYATAPEAIEVDSGLTLWDGRTPPEIDRINVLLCRDGDEARGRLRIWEDSLDGVAILVALPVADEGDVDRRLARELGGVALMLLPSDTTPANALERIGQLIGAPDAPVSIGDRATDGDMDPAYGADDLGVGPRDRDTWLEAMRDSGPDD